MTKFSSTIFGFALAGILGAAVAVLAMNIGNSKATAVASGEARGTAEIEQLSDRIDRLMDRIEILEKAPPMSGAPGVVAPAAAVPSDADATPLAAPPLSPAIDERVKELVKENQANQMQQWGDRFANMAKQRESGMLDRLAETNGLNTWQRTEMEKVLEKRREAIGAFFRGMFGGEGEQPTDMSKIREKMEEVRKETDLEIQDILNPEQYKAYEADPSNQRGGRGPWGGGGGGGGMGGGR